MTDAQRQAEILSLWVHRPPDKRTENDVIKFYGELVSKRPDLLKLGEGDSYPQLKADLRGHIAD